MRKEEVVPEDAEVVSPEIEEPLVSAPKNADEEEPEVVVNLSLKLEELPTMKDMQNLDEEELHNTPESVTKAGEQIGQLLHEGDQDPLLQDATLKLLLKCAESKDVVPSIRALCWKKTMNYLPRWNKAIPLNEFDVPLEIKLLGEKID